MSLREFWRRWHISLSTWLRENLYVSLGGNRRGAARTSMNVFVTMLLGGLWHGAAWNFVLWGAWHGMALVVERTLAGNLNLQISSSKSPLSRGAGWLATMSVVFYGWLLFRAGSAHQVLMMTRALGDWQAPGWIGSYALNLGIFTAPLAVMEIWQGRAQNLLAPLTLTGWTRALLQGVLLAGIILFWGRAHAPFIYFQF
jgi:D-alanyl-lipoteichoic acid acyltransferase DltB (MBOAT superfamily)